MKIVLLDAKTLGVDINYRIYKKYSTLTIFETTDKIKIAISINF